MRIARILALLAALAAPICGAQQHAGDYSPADVEDGARLYGAHCFTCHGAAGDQISGVDLLRGKFRRGSSDEELMRTINQGIPDTAMTPNKFTPLELAALVAYLRSMRDSASRAVALGDSRRGQLLFERSLEGKNGCLDCHRVNGKGSLTGPDLSEIGAVRSAESLERAILEPGGSARPQNRFVRAVTAQGKVIRGRRLNEDTFTVQLIDDQARLVSLSKRELREYAVVKTPIMPSYQDKLSDAERADLVAYLMSLKVSEEGKAKP